MRQTIKILVVLTVGLLLTACNGKNKSDTQNLDQSISKIEVLDFHSTHRCMTCNAIETNTKFTLDTYFSDEMKADKITFQVINVDEKDLTEFAFMNGNDQDVFSKELKTKIDTELKTL